jgi:hypothetical protein
MASTVGAFALFALFLAHNHRWTDTLLSHFPTAGGAIRPANDGIVAEQLRITEVRTEHLTLADRSVALLFEASVVNDSAIPVRGIVLEVEGFRDGVKVAEAEGTCGKNVNVRLLRRMSRNEMVSLMKLDAPAAGDLASGSRTGCQVALTQLRTEVDEVSYRIASAEAIAGHRAAPDPFPGPWASE